MGFPRKFFLAKIIDLEQTMFHANPVFIQALYRISQKQKYSIGFSLTYANLVDSG